MENLLDGCGMYDPVGYSEIATSVPVRMAGFSGWRPLVPEKQ